jgi:hypothetical protein
VRRWLARFRDLSMNVEGSNEEAARNAACEEFRQLHPEDRKVQAHLIAITPASEDEGQ